MTEAKESAQVNATGSDFHILYNIFVEVLYILGKADSTEGLLLLIIKSRLLSFHHEDLVLIIIVKPGVTKGTST